MSKLVVTVVSGDAIYLNQERHDLSGLDGRLAEMTEAERADIRTVVLEGDSDVPYSLTIGVLDVLRRNGFRGINLRTRER